MTVCKVCKLRAKKAVIHNSLFFINILTFLFSNPFCKVEEVSLFFLICFH